MPKAMCVIGVVVAILLVLLFGLDAFLAVPFATSSMAMDVGMMVGGVALAYVSWATFREQK
jgi:hypothetical protein